MGSFPSLVVHRDHLALAAFYQINPRYQPKTLRRHVNRAGMHLLIKRSIIVWLGKRSAAHIDPPMGVLGATAAGAPSGRSLSSPSGGMVSTYAGRKKPRPKWHE